MILCDTNILIEFYKGNTAIKADLQQLGLANLSISVITAGELYYGAKDKRELKRIQKHLALLTQMSLDTAISSRFLDLLDQYALSHKLSVPDALIAATAIEHALSLYTLNIKDFRYITGLQLYRPVI